MSGSQRFCTGCGTPLSAAFCTECGLRAPDGVEDPGRTSLVVAPRTEVMPVASTPWSEPGPRTTGRGRRALVQGVVAFAVVVALGIGSVVGYGWWRDRPVNEALGSARTAVESVLGPLDRATALEDVSAAGEAAPQAVATIRKALAGLDDEDGDLAARTRDVLTDQIALMEAIAPLAGIGEDSLGVWGTALPEVEVAESAVLSSRRELAGVDAGVADAVMDPAKAVEQAISVVGGAADGALTAELSGFLDELAKVRTTRAAAALGERADAATEAARAAGTGQTGPAAERLTRLADALGAINALSVMDPETLYVWGDAKSVLADSTQALGLDSAGALDSMSDWVGEAQVTMDEWQQSYDLAEAARSSTTARLDDYARTVRGVLRDYDRARDGTADALEAAELDDYTASYEVEYAMEEGVLTRQDLVNQLDAATPPSGMGSAHADLVAVIESGVSAMTTGEQAVEDWNACYEDCTDSFRDMSGWQDFSDASSDISDRFDSARKGWDAALSSALDSANAVPLPALPKV